MHDIRVRLDLMGKATSRRRFVKAAVLMPVVGGLTVPSLLAEPIIAHAQARKNGVARLDVFASGSNGTVQHKWFDNGWSNWENLGGTLSSGPAATSWGVGRIDIFGLGSGDRTLQHKWFDNGAWSGWESLGGDLRTGPAAVSW